MPSLITNKLEQLFSSLIDPVWTWVLRLPWTGRLAILLVTAAASVASFNWKETQHVLDTVAPIAAVALHYDFSSMPLSDDYVRGASEGVQRLATSLEADLSTKDNLFAQEPGPWTPAQIVVALGETWAFQPENLIAYFRSQAELTCSCWKEFPGKAYAVASGAINIW